MSIFKFVAMVIGVMAAAFLLMFIVETCATEAQAYSENVRVNILVHQNALICDSVEKLEEGIKYWQKNNINKFDLLTRGPECFLNSGQPFRAFLTEGGPKYSTINYQVDENGFIITKDGYIANGAYSLWQWGN